jgi:hypothetical protein
MAPVEALASIDATVMMVEAEVSARHTARLSSHPTAPRLPRLWLFPDGTM